MASELPSDLGSPESVFKTQKDKALSFLDWMDKSFPEVKAKMELVRDKIAGISANFDQAQKVNDEMKISKLAAELRDVLKSGDVYFVMYQLQKSNGVTLVKLNSIMSDADKEQKITPRGLALHDALFISDDGKNYTILNAVSNVVKLADNKVYPITDTSGNTKNYIKVTLWNDRIGFMEMKYFDLDAGGAKSRVSGEMEARQVTVEAGGKKLATVPAGFARDVRYEEVLERGNDAEIKHYIINTAADLLEDIKDDFEKSGTPLDAQAVVKRLLGEADFKTLVGYKINDEEVKKSVMHGLAEAEGMVDKWLTKNTTDSDQISISDLKTGREFIKTAAKDSRSSL